jgi:hypothetical protein
MYASVTDNLQGVLNGSLIIKTSSKNLFFIFIANNPRPQKIVQPDKKPNTRKKSSPSPRAALKNERQAIQILTFVNKSKVATVFVIKSPICEYYFVANALDKNKQIHFQ